MRQVFLDQWVGSSLVMVLATFCSPSEPFTFSVKHRLLPNKTRKKILPSIVRKLHKIKQNKTEQKTEIRAKIYLFHTMQFIKVLQGNVRH